MNGETAGHWESTVLTFGPDAGRVGWRPVGRDSRWQSNIPFHPERLAPDPGHSHPATAAGPDDPAPPRDAGPHGDLGPPETLGPYGDTGPPGDAEPLGDLGPPDAALLGDTGSSDDAGSLGDTGPPGDEPSGPRPTMIVVHRPSPLTGHGPPDPPSGAEQILTRLLAQAS
ncbi:hypothetical protein [Gordonia iterans]